MFPLQMVVVVVNMVTVRLQAGPRGEGQWNETPQTGDPKHGQQQPRHGQLPPHRGEITDAANTAPGRIDSAQTHFLLKVKCSSLLFPIIFPRGTLHASACSQSTTCHTAAASTAS